MQKTKLQSVILTFFTLFPQVPRQEPPIRQSTSAAKCAMRVAIATAKLLADVGLRSLVRLSIRDKDARSADR